MATTFRPYAPDQPHLFPPSPEEWLPKEHLAYFVSDAVDTFDLTPFYTPYLGDGRRNSPCDPRMMLKVLIYAYATGVFSSRKIDRSLGDSATFRVLAGGHHPKHRTICDFRKRHLDDFRALFVRVACEMGRVSFGTLSIYGMKMRANASKRKAMSYGRMIPEKAKRRQEISALHVFRAGRHLLPLFCQWALVPSHGYRVHFPPGLCRSFQHCGQQRCRH